MNSTQDDFKETYTKTHYNQILEKQRQRENIESIKREEIHTYKGSSKILSVDFLSETLDTRRPWAGTFKVLQDKTANQESYLAKRTFKNEGEMKTFLLNKS